MNNKQETIYTNEDIIKHIGSRDSVELYIDAASYNKSSNEENIKNILKNINLEINAGAATPESNSAAACEIEQI